MAEPETQILLEPLPTHVAIIMDGNGRWAKARNMPRVAGHRRGAEAVRATVRAARELGVRYLTLYAFSSENWRRPAEEVSDLMGLMRLYLRREIAELHANNVRVRFIGDRERLADDIRALMSNAETTTAGNDGLTLVIAVNYGGQAEIVRAARLLAEAVARGEMRPCDIDEAAVGRCLDLPDVPEPDLLIRTSGEQRLSNFLLWQAAYSELVFDETYWPDYGRDALLRAIEVYCRRDRRFGGRSD